MVSFVLPAFDDIASLGYPPRRVVYLPGSLVPPWVTDSRFLAGNVEAELKRTTLSSLQPPLLRISFKWKSLCTPPHA